MYYILINTEMSMTQVWHKYDKNRLEAFAESFSNRGRMAFDPAGDTNGPITVQVKQVRKLAKIYANDKSLPKFTSLIYITFTDNVKSGNREPKSIVNNAPFYAVEYAVSCNSLFEGFF